MGLIRALIALLPAELRYFLSLLAFWPSILYTRLYAHFFPARRRLFDAVAPGLLLGVVPIFATDRAALARHGVSAVVNLCREWDWQAQAHSLGMSYLRLPTIDMDIPTYGAVKAGAAFIAAAVKRGETVYVHCKAGRGRSTVVVLAYLVLYCGMSPEAADAQVRRARPHVTRKASHPLMRRLAAEAAAGGEVTASTAGEKGSSSGKS